MIGNGDVPAALVDRESGYDVSSLSLDLILKQSVSQACGSDAACWRIAALDVGRTGGLR